MIHNAQKIVVGELVFVQRHLIFGNISFSWVQTVKVFAIQLVQYITGVIVIPLTVQVVLVMVNIWNTLEECVGAFIILRELRRHVQGNAFQIV